MTSSHSVSHGRRRRYTRFGKMMGSFTRGISSIICCSYILTNFGSFGTPVPNESEILKLDLNADRNSGIWTVQGRKESQVIKVPASVPGGIYSDLEASGLLSSEIYYDYNDLESKWVGRTNWTYLRRFSVPPHFLSKRRVVLVCHGLDTVSQVYINGRQVGSSKNMFVRYIFDVKNVLKAGANTMRISFVSPVLYALKQYNQHEVTYGYPVTPEELVPEYRGENKAQMIRKMQSSFSWDWGPSYASSGIWKDIYLESFSTALIRDVLIFTSPNKQVPTESRGTEWALTARVYFDVAAITERGSLSLRLYTPGEIITARIRVNLRRDENSPRDITVIIPGDYVKLWWPNGYGTQNLYDCELIYTSHLITPQGNSSSPSSRKKLRIGFRTVDLVQDFVNVTNPEWGREFYFKVNGRKIYSKGSNSIPMHVLPEKVTKEMAHWLLSSAVSLHQNMIRVWGGGIYENEYFYDLADELGILIWQDFMFACAMYPATDQFLENVLDEVDTQVKRLQHHASLAMWAANNENEAALRGNWYQTYHRFNTYREDFIKLYVDTIIGNVTALDPSRECLSSSPTNGIRTQKEGWIAINPGSVRYGDIHHYDYYGDTWRAEAFMFKRARYSSEYGFQSFPYIATLKNVTNNFDEWTWKSDMVEHRQRHPKGQNEMRALIESHLPYPRNFDSAEAFPAMIYMSQIMQSYSMKTETEFYRRQMDKLSNDGIGHNMGALYWQLNDIWQGVSWASFEINGRWKMLANYMQRAFSPVLPSPYKSRGGYLAVELISDSLSDFHGKMRVRLFKINNMSPLLDRSVEVNASFLTSKEVHMITNDEMESLGCKLYIMTFETPDFPCFLYITTNGTVPVPDNFLLIHYPIKKEHLQDPKLRVVDIIPSNNGSNFTITLETEQIAPFVFLNLWNYTHGHFSDNGFFMVEHTKTLTYYASSPISLEKFREELRIESLYNVTSVA